MQVTYIKPHHRMIESLVNETTTIKHDLSDWIMDSPIESLQGNALNASYSIPTETKNPTLSDICAIHLTDPSGMIVTSKTDIRGSEWDFAEHIDAMVDSLPEKGYVVVIESVRDGVKLRNDVEINATHRYLAIEGAFEGVMNTVNNDIFDKDTGLPYSQARLQTDSIINDCASNRRDIEVKLDNGNHYKLLAICETDRFENSFSCTTH